MTMLEAIAIGVLAVCGMFLLLVFGILFVHLVIKTASRIIRYFEDR